MTDSQLVLEGGDDLFPEQLYGAFDLGVRNLVALHYEQRLVGADLLMAFDALDATVGISGDDHPAFGQQIGGKLSQLRSRDSAPAQVLISALESREIGGQVVGNTTPGLQQALVNVGAVGGVGPVWAEELFDGFGAELFGFLVIVSAVSQSEVGPLIVDETSNRHC